LLLPATGFDEYQCIFHRFNQPYGARYSWDFRSLCADAGKEYVAFAVPIGASPSPSPSPSVYTTPRIIFNVCGGVSGIVVAPYKAGAPNNVNMSLPRPHSHGTAIQIIDDPAKYANINCPDSDTCDQATNPDCVPGTLNYLANRTGNNPYTCDPLCHPIDHNAAMEAVCAGPSPLPAACTVSSTKCTDNMELISYYNGLAPAFSLFDEGTAGGVTALSPNNGINLSYTPALAFSDDNSCTAKDARTGEAVVRTVNVFIACDAAGYDSAPLNVVGYTEEGQCQYYIRTSHKLGCGAAGDPYDPAAFPSFAPCPSAAPAAAAVAFNLNTQQLVGATVGLVALLTVAVQTLVIILMFCFCVPEATRQASLDAFYQRFCCCCCCGSGVRPRFAGVATSASGVRSPKAYFKDGHAKTETILPGSAGMFVARAGGSDRFAANPLGALNTVGDRAVAPGATL